MKKALDTVRGFGQAPQHSRSAPGGAQTDRDVSLSIDSQPGPLRRRLIGQTRVMRELFNTMGKLAVLDCPVLMWGEPGTGKETIARTMHDRNPRATGPFLSLGCAYFGAELLERELFGRETPASRPGLIEDARGGTLFFDEVWSLPLPMQERLARVIDTQRLRHPGASPESPEVEIDVRVIAASALSPEEAEDRGRAHPALIDTLAAYVLHVPPLRERMADIPLLSRFLVARYANEFRKDVHALADDALEVMMLHDYPGNILELESIIESAVITADGDVVQFEDLPPLPRQPVAVGPGITDSTPQEDEPVSEPIDHADDDGEDCDGTCERPCCLCSLGELEAEHILKVLEAVQGNRNKAADILGISRSSLWRKLNRLGYDG